MVQVHQVISGGKTAKEVTAFVGGRIRTLHIKRSSNGIWTFCDGNIGDMPILAPIEL